MSLRDLLNRSPDHTHARIVMVPYDEWAEALSEAVEPTKPRLRRMLADLKKGAAGALKRGQAEAPEGMEVGIHADNLKAVLEMAQADAEKPPIHPAAGSTKSTKKADPSPTT